MEDNDPFEASGIYKGSFVQKRTNRTTVESNMKGIFPSKYSTIFIFICVILFTYNASECIYCYLKQEPLTRSTLEKQELHPLPSICISQSATTSEQKLSAKNLTSNEYNKEGKWQSDFSTLDEEGFYDEISASFEDLVEKIVLEKAINGDSDAYEEVTLDRSDGLILERCDYYDELKCFCINFADKLTSQGIQRIKLFMKMYSRITVAAPGNYFTFDRKQAEINYAHGFEYRYHLQHTISNALPLGANSCTKATDWKVDFYRLKYINDKMINMLNCTTPWLLHFAR